MSLAVSEAVMRVFVTGASGYIGGSVAGLLVAAGHAVRGLTRDKADALRERGIAPVVGSLDDAALLAEEARAADAVVNAAEAGHRGAAEALVRALAGSGKRLIHTSGSSIVARDDGGEFSDRVLDEATPFTPVAAKAERVAIDGIVRGAAASGVHSVVLCPTLIYGAGTGLHRESVQLPLLIAQARASGVARHAGQGLNLWSNVHVEDVAALYVIALERAPAGSFYFVENGETSFRAKTQAIADALGLGPAEDWPMEQAIAAWGEERTRYSLASNSRVKADRARALGWQPKHNSVLEHIANSVHASS
jgi:nucleoside-diphosphate-sugar epimerase